MGINEFGGGFSTAFDPLGSGLASALCISVDWSPYGDQAAIDALDPFQKLSAEHFAQMAIRVLTGFQVGNCPITVRPCAASCLNSAAWIPGTAPYTPYINNGQWFNTCGHRPDGCSCDDTLEKIILPGPVGDVIEVKVDGAILPTTAYRVDNSNELIRLGGEVWPTSQDMALADTAVGTMSVTYVRGVLLDTMGQLIAGLLAIQYLNASEGKECQLPSSVTSLSRQGVQMEFGPDVFPNGLTGIEAVDLWVRSWNPYSVKSPARIYSPDQSQARQATWMS